MINELNPARGLIKNPRKLITELPHFLFSNEGDLKKKVIRGGFWVFSLRILDRAFQFIRTIILARLLAPEDFGLMGIALLAMSALESFSQTGVVHALIQKNEDVEDYLDTAWTIQVIRGTAIALILFFGAPLVGTFFGEPNAIPLTRALALSELFKGLTHIGVVYFKKELEFKKQFIYQISGTIADLFISIPAALILKNPWALIIGSVTGNFIRLIFSFIVSSRTLSISINKKYAKHLYNFGKYIFLQSILLFLLTQGDDAFVGKFLGATSLGIYQLGYRISNMTATEITHVISSVTFPAYAKLQNNKKKLALALKETLKISSFLTFPIAGGIFILAPEFIQLFLGEQWLNVIPIIRILAFEGLLRSISSVFGPVYRATYNLKSMIGISLTQLASLILVIWPLATKFDVNGVAIAVTIMLVVGFFNSLYVVSNITTIDLLDLLKIFIPSMSGSLFAIIIVLLFKKQFFITPSYFTLGALSIIYVSLYLAITSIFVFINNKKKTTNYDAK